MSSLRKTQVPCVAHNALRFRYIVDPAMLAAAVLIMGAAR